jgi:hypothetical protein
LSKSDSNSSLAPSVLNTLVTPDQFLGNKCLIVKITTLLQPYLCLNKLWTATVIILCM